MGAPNPSPPPTDGVGASIPQGDWLVAVPGRGHRCGLRGGLLQPGGQQLRRAARLLQRTAGAGAAEGPGASGVTWS